MRLPGFLRSWIEYCGNLYFLSEQCMESFQQSFPEALLYNPQTGQFELVDRAAELVSRRIRSVLHRSKSQLLTGGPTAPARTPPVDNRYTFCCLDREQGIQWILKERLPFFLLSDCYSEYRLAKLLFEWNPVLCIHRRKGGSGRTPMSAPQLHFSSQTVKENNKALKVLTCSYSQENRSAKQGSTRRLNVTCLCSDHIEHLNTKCSVSFRCSEQKNICTFSSCSSYSLKCGKSPNLQGTQTEWILHGTEERSGKKASEVQLEELAASVVKQVLNNALSLMDARSQANTSDCLSRPGDQTHCNSTHRSCERRVCIQHLADGGTERLGGEKEKVQEGEEKIKWPKKNSEVGRRDRDQENINMCCLDTCCCGNRQGVDELKEFLRGTSGEKLLNLWMDIERLKAAQSRERKNRHLVLMRSRYLVGSSPSSLTVELLSRLGLTTSPCWTEDRLHAVQPSVTEALLHYWVPRFWTSHCARAEHEDPPLLELWTACGVRPLSDTQPHHGSPTTMPPSPNSIHTQLYSSRNMDSSRMEKMIQALCADSCAGLYFTNFCEQSGNQLWENALCFWTDLQHYHELFYQDGLDLYRVQREAQLLYSTFLSSSARRSIRVDEEIRTQVYDQLMPAFEQVFDRVEEHTLKILLEPWTLLISRDKESLQKVLMQEEVRQVDSLEYRELQSLYEESQSRLKQVEQCQSMLFPSPIKNRAPDSWSRVSPNLHGYRLGSLLRHRQEIEHFMSFLQNHDASIHLTCWLDLEQYRRTAQTDTAVRQERSSHIATKYLDRKYFFGSDSPASTEQQNDLLRQAGGLERLKLECLSDPVVVEIQAIIRSHIEKNWLPLFLSTVEFTERLKNQPKRQLDQPSAMPQTAGRPLQNVYWGGRRRAASEAGGLWMSSSKEILLFRRILLDPNNCMRFQHFVSLKGDFLEKDVLFWLEVQRYKDLCHSHSDEATIQQKISTIINCFINSSMPPALQIDIPPEQAQHILEKRQQLGPYIFREAQMSVFSALLKLWPEFRELSSSVHEEQLLPLLQEKQVQHKARVRRQRRKEEEEEEEDRKISQEDLERPESSFREEEETDEEDDIEQGQERRYVTQEWRKSSRVLLTPTLPLSWSYSKYMAALRREEVLLRRQRQLGASISASGSSSDCSVRSAGRISSRPSGTDSKQCDQYSSK
ncbi:regulator of G-protein signaling 22 isoform X2 [Eleginops maclovinus]|uniref:regulator of G-protein signaling 22 isoform X2 n=1 Tax=Eleginops maclovinus TaxID=56733 RepID=UPI0030808F40